MSALSDAEESEVPVVSVPVVVVVGTEIVDPLASLDVPLNVVEDAEMLKMPLSARIPVELLLLGSGIDINLTRKLPLTTHPPLGGLTEMGILSPVAVVVTCASNCSDIPKS